MISRILERGECPQAGQAACHHGDDGSYDTDITPVTRLIPAGTRNQLEMQITTNITVTNRTQEAERGPLSHHHTPYPALHSGHPRVERDFRWPPQCAVHYGTADGVTSPWLQDDSIRLEFKWELEKKEREEYKMNANFWWNEDAMMKGGQNLFHSGSGWLFTSWSWWLLWLQFHRYYYLMTVTIRKHIN